MGGLWSVRHAVVLGAVVGAGLTVGGPGAGAAEREFGWARSTDGFRLRLLVTGPVAKVRVGIAAEPAGSVSVAGCDGTAGTDARRVCLLDEVSDERAVDVWVDAPDEVREVMLAAVARMRSKTGEPIVRAALATAVESSLPSSTPDLSGMPDLLRAAGSAAGVSLHRHPTETESRDTGGVEERGNGTLMAPRTPGPESSRAREAGPETSWDGEPGASRGKRPEAEASRDGEVGPEASRDGEPGASWGERPEASWDEELETGGSRDGEVGPEVTIPPVERPDVSSAPPVRRQGGPAARRPGPAAPSVKRPNEPVMRRPTVPAPSMGRPEVFGGPPGVRPEVSGVPPVGRPEVSGVPPVGRPGVLGGPPVGRPGISVAPSVRAPVVVPDGSVVPPSGWPGSATRSDGSLGRPDGEVRVTLPPARPAVTSTPTVTPSGVPLPGELRGVGAAVGGAGIRGQAATSGDLPEIRRLPVALAAILLFLGLLWAQSRFRVSRPKR